MWDKITSLTEDLDEVRQEKEEKEQKLSDLQSETFGTDSEETEQKARNFFSSLGVEENQGRTQEIDNIREELSNIEEKVEELEEDILRELTDVKFPFNETIDQREGEIAFPFSDSLPKETIDQILGIVRNGVEHGNVELKTDEIVAKVEDVDSAIDEVEKFTNKLREAARHDLNIDNYVQKLADRDIKVRRMLYELYESEESLAKKELEMRTGVGSGGLRGVLYHVYDNDPYLLKEDKKYRLSEIGKDVMGKFLDQHGVPDKPVGEGSKEEDTGDQESDQASLVEAGDSNE